MQRSIKRAPLWIIGLLLAATAVGWLIGALEYVLYTWLLARFDGILPAYIGILRWVLLVVLIALGGLFLRAGLRWTLTRIRCRQGALAVSLALAAAALLLYGLLAGYALGLYLRLLAMPWSIFLPGESPALVTAAILAQGGRWRAANVLAAPGLFGTVHLLVLLAAAVGYIVVAIGAAVRAAPDSPAGGEKAARAAPALACWLTLAATVLLVTLPLLVLPLEPTTRLDAVTHVRRGQGYFFEGRVGKAIESYDLALAIDPASFEAHYWLGEAYRFWGEHTKAIPAYEQAIRLNPGLVQAHERLGQSYYDQGRLALALESFQEALRLDPHRPTIHNHRGWAWLDLGDLDRAGAAFREALRLAPDLFSAHNGLGLVALRQGAYETAQDSFHAVLALDPYNLLAYEGLGEACYLQGDFDDALFFLQGAINLNSRSLNVYLYLSLTYMTRGDFTEAVTPLETLATAIPGWGAPHAFLASVYYQLDQPERLEQELQAAQSLAGDDGFTHYALGLAYANSEQAPEAIRHFQAYLTLTPDAPDSERVKALIEELQAP